MVDCEYCGTSFNDEGAYHDHLRATHADELGRIDRRRLGLEGDDGGSTFPTGQILIVVFILLAIAALGYVIVQPGASACGVGEITPPIEPCGQDTVHYHGSMNVTVMGDQVDFSQSQYQLQANAFHFEAGNGARWHVHAKQVTLGWAMDSLGIDVTQDTVTYQGRTYRDGEAGVDVTVTVNGEPVDPSTYILEERDHVRIIVTNASS